MHLAYAPGDHAVLTSLHTRNFRMLADHRVRLGPFHVLVGQNATGKSTFFAGLRLIAEVIERGAREATARMAASFHDLCFRPGEPIGFGVEVRVPVGEVQALVRYEMELGLAGDDALQILFERLSLVDDSNPRTDVTTDGEVLTIRADDGTMELFGRAKDPRAFVDMRLEIDRDRSMLGFLPDSPAYAPGRAARDFLRSGIRMLELDAAALRTPSPPGSLSTLALGGGNLPHVVRDLERRDPTRFAEWVAHMRTGVGALVDVDVWERPEDRHLVLRARFEGARQAPVPSWLLSDGTLRLMALTLVSYAALPGRPALLMIEEPENGLHPLAIQAAYDALAHPPDGVQVLCATHSPIFIAHAQLDEALVFRRATDGTAIVRRGRDVPELASWRGGDLADLFVTGVLS